MTTAIATNGTSQSAAAIMERVVIAGDLAALSPQERVRYYMETCQSLGLNPLTRPFEYIELNKKLTLYPTRTTTDQLREQKGISVRVIERKLDLDAGIYTVEVEAQTPDGRRDFATGVVPVVKEDGEWKQNANNKSYFEKNGRLIPLRGDDLANAMMKAETKAKRRVTLSIVGLGWTDESELETIPSARPVRVDPATGIIEGQETRPTSNGNGNGHTDAPALPTLTDLQARWLGLVEQADELGIVLKSRELDTTRPLDSLARTVHALALKVAEVQAALEAERPGAEVEEEKFPF